MPDAKPLSAEEVNALEHERSVVRSADAGVTAIQIMALIDTVRDRERQRDNFQTLFKASEQNNRELRQERDELQCQLAEARKAITDLLSKWDSIEPILNGHLALEAVHGRPYVGPNMAAELTELRRIDAVRGQAILDAIKGKP